MALLNVLALSSGKGIPSFPYSIAWPIPYLLGCANVLRQGIMEEIRDLKPERNLKSAEIRIFCVIMTTAGRQEERRVGMIRPSMCDDSYYMIELILFAVRWSQNLNHLVEWRFAGRCYERKTVAPKDKNDPRAGHHADRITVTVSIFFLNSCSPELMPLYAVVRLCLRGQWLPNSLYGRGQEREPRGLEHHEAFVHGFPNHHS